jgi:hypothetical protein
MVSNGVNPKDVKILRPEIAKFDCKSGTFNLGEEETNENNLSTYLMSKFCRK